MGFTTTGGLMALGICLGASVAAAGDRYPTTGLVHNKLENSALQYDCTLLGEVLECEFAVTSVSHMHTPPSPQKNRTRPQRVYFADKRPSLRECDGYQQLISALKNGQAPNGLGQKEFEEGIAWFASVDGQDFQAVTSFFSDYCSQPSRRRGLKVVRPGHDKTVRACSITTRRYSQRFNKQPQSENWIAASTSPEACGKTRRDRFAPETSARGDSVWTYFTGRPVSNKPPTARGAENCAGLIEAESRYDWHPHKIQLACDSISFGLN